MIGTRSPIARPRPKETPTRSPVKEPGPVATATLVTSRERAMRLSAARSSGLRAGMNISVRRPPSIVASAAMLDEVSMTKVTLRPDQTAVAAHVLELDERVLVQPLRRLRRHLPTEWGGQQPVSPLDHDRAIFRELLEAKVAELRAALDPVKVDVRELHPPGVDPHELEGRAGDLRPRPRPLCHAAYERGLPRTELAGQEDDVARLQLLAEQHPDALCLGWRVSYVLGQSGRSRCASGQRRGRSPAGPRSIGRPGAGRPGR